MGRSFYGFETYVNDESEAKLRKHYRKATEIAELASNLARKSGEAADDLRAREAWGRVAGVRETAQIMGVKF